MLGNTFRNWGTCWELDGAIGLLQDDVKKKKHLELARKKELQAKNKNVDGKVVINVNLDVDVGMSRVDDVEPLI